MKRNAFLLTLLAFFLPKKAKATLTDAQKIAAILALRTDMQPIAQTQQIESYNFESPSDQFNNVVEWSNLKYYLNGVNDILNS